MEEEKALSVYFSRFDTVTPIRQLLPVQIKSLGGATLLLPSFLFPTPSPHSYIYELLAQTPNDRKVFPSVPQQHVFDIILYGAEYFQRRHRLNGSNRETLYID